MSLGARREGLGGPTPSGAEVPSAHRRRPTRTSLRSTLIRTALLKNTAGSTAPAWSSKSPHLDPPAPPCRGPPPTSSRCGVGGGGSRLRRNGPRRWRSGSLGNPPPRATTSSPRRSPFAGNRSSRSGHALWGTNRLWSLGRRLGTTRPQGGHRLQAAPLAADLATRTTLEAGSAGTAETREGVERKRREQWATPGLARGLVGR